MNFPGKASKDSFKNSSRNSCNHFSMDLSFYRNSLKDPLSFFSRNSSRNPSNNFRATLPTIYLAIPHRNYPRVYSITTYKGSFDFFKRISTWISSKTSPRIFYSSFSKDFKHNFSTIFSRNPFKDSSMNVSMDFSRNYFSDSSRHLFRNNYCPRPAHHI